MKIVLYAHALAATGVVRNVRLLASDFRGRGHGVEIVTALPGGEGATGVAHHALLPSECGSRTLQKWRAVPRLHAYLRRTRPDIMLSAGNHGHLTALLGSQGIPGLRRLYRISNDILRAAQGAPRSRVGTISRSVFAHVLAADADHLVLVSPMLATGTPAFGRALARGRATIIENAIDPTIARTRAAGPAPHGWYDKGGPIVIAIGRLAPQKNFGTLLTALVQMQRDGAPAKLIILGDGRDGARQALRDEADRLEIGSSVLLPGKVENVFPWLARAHAFILPSWWEGSANVLLEAMALEVPVVASRSAGNAASVLDHGRHGLLVDPADPAAMAKAIAQQIDPASAVRPGERITAYRLDNMLDAWAALLDAWPDSPGCRVRHHRLNRHTTHEQR